MRSFRLSPLLGSVLLLVTLAVTGLVAGQNSAPSGWTPELSMKVKAVGNVRVSPDGRKVTYTVTQAVMAPDKSEFVSQIWLANNDGSDQMQLTFAEKSSDNPQWSRMPHGPNEPKMVLKAKQTNLEWFEKYLGASR